MLEKEGRKGRSTWAYLPGEHNHRCAASRGSWQQHGQMHGWRPCVPACTARPAARIHSLLKSATPDWIGSMHAILSPAAAACCHTHIHFDEPATPFPPTRRMLHLRSPLQSSRERVSLLLPVASVPEPRTDHRTVNTPPPPPVSDVGTRVTTWIQGIRSSRT